MMIRSLQDSGAYERSRKGLAGAGFDWREKVRSSEPNSKTFADYLEESFQGDLVQDGNWFSETLSELSKKNLRKI
ncbi:MULTISPECIES: LIC12298 family protein [Leptospira]|uniref:Uncharacterized protein n=6 Tax=Leptospira TaxID=171 RepID=A0A2P2D139_9LEPT|nr:MULTISPECIES: hypothetical protein [Leptospira]PJZ48924.1 hypothetical protein CH362_10790 [Leptospira saintgironsiae]PKA16632.1 hypothetical protein CH363_07625 [Leptospira haakeii]PKA20653.1 hypothetical protein CH377_07030 [Leptospira haakeii]TGK42349.1 hypothetical protein EHO65_06215 [Leptospira andrefontaineae]TGL28276.1 hypothetical protein EHQ52_18580 [Leptospira koniambonensis]